MLTICKTRQKIKEAYASEFAATIERAEKQIILARHGRRLLNLLDDTPVIPGDTRPEFPHANQARQILNDAEDDLREWQPELEEVGSSAGLIENNLMPITPQPQSAGGIDEPATSGTGPVEGSHLAEHNESSRVTSGSGTSTTTEPTYAPSESEAGIVTH